MRTSIYVGIVTTLCLSAFPTLEAQTAPTTAPKSPHSQRHADGEMQDTHHTLMRAAEVYKHFTTQNKIPSSVLQNTNCIAIFPDVTTIALAVGGTHGNGAVFCKTASGKWGSPVFLNLSGGSLGLQVGAKSTDLILYMSGAKARSAIEKGQLNLSGELSAVAGSFDETFSAPRESVIAYSQAEGMFAGIALGAMNISLDKEDQRKFYGTYNPASIFEDKTPSAAKNMLQELQSMLPT